ncbi:hypothetical protein [Lysinibacillus sp. NPDC056232]|uniref:hypothetical protein n=1 Tax=Lysinibacillus sp. NPDC056232 TaxID=3345756 RepID=UPI0035E30CE3
MANGGVNESSLSCIGSSYKLVDKDNNDMWFNQGIKEGGIATGIFTKEQESNYILQVFGTQ